MTAPTHVTFAEFVYLLLLTTMGVALTWANGLTIAFASVLADIDTGASWIGHWLTPQHCSTEFQKPPIDTNPGN